MWQFQAMLSWLPAGLIYWFTVIVFFGGIVAYVLSKLAGWIPIVSRYRLPIELGAVVAILLGGYLYGGVEYRLKAQEMAEKVKIAEEQSREANKELSRQIKDKNQQIKDQAARLKDSVRQNAQRFDSQCTVDSEAVRIINEAAKEPKKK